MDKEKRNLRKEGDGLNRQRSKKKKTKKNILEEKK
jgi:hypothetical protein